MQEALRRDDRTPGASEVGPERSWFDHFADRATGIISHGPFFVTALLVVLIWAVLGFFVVGFSQAWANALNLFAVIVTLLMVALLENEQRRSDQAVQRKLNSLADALAEFLDKATEVDSRRVEELQAAVALEERESTPGARS